MTQPHNPSTACYEDSVTGESVTVMGAGGAGFIGSPQLSLVIYTLSGFTYLCEAAMGTARSAALWRIYRTTDATGDGVWAGAVGSTVGTFGFAATNSTVVAAHTYTLGA